MEAEPEAFHAEVRAAFLRRAAAAPERYLVLEADRPRDEVAAAVLAAVLDRLERRPQLRSDGPRRRGPSDRSSAAAVARRSTAPADVSELWDEVIGQPELVATLAHAVGRRRAHPPRRARARR